MRFLLLAALVVCAAAVQAQPSRNQSQPAPKEASKAAAKPAEAAKPAASSAQADASLEAVIRAKFAKSTINADHFQVHVQGGIATIEGKTDIVQRKGVATRLAKNAGARAVNNHIQVSDAAKQKAAGNLEAGRRRVQVKRGEPRSETPAKQSSK